MKERAMASNVSRIYFVVASHFVASYFVATERSVRFRDGGAADKVDRGNRHQSRVPRRIHPCLSCHAPRYLPLLTLRTRAAVCYTPVNARGAASRLFINSRARTGRFRRRFSDRP